MKTYSLMLLIFFALSFSLPSVPAASAAEGFEEALMAVAAQTEAKTVEKPPPALSPEAIYAFHEHLFSAEAVTFLSDREVAGEWRQTYFAFNGLSPKAEIRAAAAPSAETGSSVIQFNPLPKAVRRLTFYDVTPGQKMTFYYRLEQEKKTKDPNFLSVTLFLGQHQVLKMRFPPDTKGQWQKEEIPLSVVSFLNRPVPVTLELASDSSGLLVFKFLAEVTK